MAFLTGGGSEMFTALGKLTTRPRLVLGLALLAAVILAVLGHGASARLLVGGTEDPSAQSSVAADTLNAHFPASRTNLVLLVHAPPGESVTDPAVAASGTRLTTLLAAQPAVAGVRSYWQTGSPQLRSRDGRYALIEAYLTGTDSQADSAYTHISQLIGGGQGGVTVSYGGQVAVNHEIRSTISADLKRAELIAFPVTFVILILVFGSVIAALLPLIVGVGAILGADAALKVIASLTSVSVFAQNLVTALGLGLAIDYALLLTRRFREERGRGLSPREAAAKTVATAGRTVAFSALTVAIALSSMLVFPAFFLRSFAYAGIAVVLFAALAAVVVIPASLALLGDRVNTLDVRRILPGRPRPPAAQGYTATHGYAEGGWVRLTGTVMRRAPVFAILVIAVLAVVGLPFFHVQFGIADYRQLPASAQSRIVQQTIDSEFTLPPTGVITVLAETSDRADLAAYAADLSRLPVTTSVVGATGTYHGGQLVQPPGPASAARTSGGLSYLSVYPDAPDISPQSEQLVRAIRTSPAPFVAMVTGDAAQIVDTEHAIGSRLPLAGLIIALATLLIVFLFTGSVLVPVLSVVFSVLSLSATFGAVVWVFQYGHGSGLLGFTPTGFIDITLPVLMFCVAFGLSMDYSLFVLSRIKERYDETGDPRMSVSYGIARTGGIITAAAVILAVVLIAVGSSRITNIKMLGLGVALAVLVDALIVRCLLVPAALALAGRRAWWAPRPLRLIADRFALREQAPEHEPHEAHEPSGASAAGGEA
jgi:putative drug exporter of the RND superfamily